MPIEHSIAHEKYIVFRAVGVVTGSDIIEANEWLYSEFHNEGLAEFQLWDFSAATQIIVDTEKIQTMAHQDRQAAQTLSQLAVAVVAPGDLIYGLSRMWQAFADDEAIQSHVFRDVGEAEIWLYSQM